MGALFSRFKTKKKEETTVEKLDKVESQIKSLDEHITKDRQREKKIWATFLLVTGFLYVFIAGFLHLFILETSSYLDKLKLGLLWTVPVVLIFFSQRWIPWYFNRGIQANREKLRKLREDKKKLLDNVRENEPYNKAKSILEKYEGPQREPFSQRQNTAATASKPTEKYVKSNAAASPFPGPSGPGFPNQGPRFPNRGLPQYSPQYPMGRPPQKKERTAVDRVLDYIVKDGPENRMALICRNCGAHNGLCLLDEYDFTGFKCFECHGGNPPRKTRPAPVAQWSFHTDPRPGSVDMASSGSGTGTGSSSGTESDSQNGVNKEGGDVVHNVVVRQAVVISKEAPVEAQPVRAAVATNLAESDTGSESDNEEETSTVEQLHSLSSPVLST